ncbi:MAG: Extensin-like protein [Candidatus Giovannonibacteria bacterium GW2011_GWB1_47_6b]|uniref:Extensin-like protein n=1 Tax=Candidatus Giovannonibacteria bacterium GW2011_GWB1_47_6b TaxID=1618655 RepID=A0A0G1T159_9BACT|nr:MAG: Extensin-like protein [Candidatus Giovannonibacteria bacterium GW2011_GWB1_47_6b]
MDYSLLTEQKISEQYKDLPQDLQSALSSANTSITIENIAATYGLNKEQSTMLVQLVGLTLLKFVSFEEMKKEMKESLEIDPVLIPLIANAIYQKILFPVINSLMPAATAVQPKTAPSPAAPAPVVAVDRYRESMPSRVVNLRKPAPLMAPVAQPRITTPPQPLVVRPMAPIIQPIAPIAKPAPVTPPKPSFYFAPLKKPVESSATPLPVKPTTPITPTAPQPPKPIFKLPLIEASPHEILTPKKEPLKQQFILRPPGMPPTEPPHDILDLRKDKGEF